MMNVFMIRIVLFLERDTFVLINPACVPLLFLVLIAISVLMIYLIPIVLFPAIQMLPASETGGVLMVEAAANVLMDGLAVTAQSHALLGFTVPMASTCNAHLEHIRQVSACLIFKIVLSAGREHSLYNLLLSVRKHASFAPQGSTNRRLPVQASNRAIFVKLEHSRLG